MTDQQTRKCFVVGPIGDEGSDKRIHADWLFDGIIVPVFKENFDDFRVTCADRISTPGMINSQIINSLYDHDLVISDLSFHNANAFYEMAIRHAAGKPIVHVILRGQTIPFDVLPHRAIPFSIATFADFDEAKANLKSAIDEALNPGFTVENPITHALGKKAMQATASPEISVLRDEVQSLKETVTALTNTLETLLTPGSPTTALGSISSGGSVWGEKPPQYIIDKWRRLIADDNERVIRALKYDDGATPKSE